MAEWVTLTAADGKELSAYVARPAGEMVGALVVVQEIFGVNDHMRRVTEGFAKDGFLAIAPALFDRVEKGVELSYEEKDRPKAFGLRGQITPEQSLLDVAAAARHVSTAGKKLGVVGYCYGGLMAWLSATRGPQNGFTPAACVGYYAGGIGKVAREEPACPVMLHFGGADDHIGTDQIDAVRTAHAGHEGEVQIFVYEGAGHAFNRDVGQSFHPAAAALARERTLRFLNEHLA